MVNTIWNKINMFQPNQQVTTFSSSALPSSSLHLPAWDTPGYPLDGALSFVHLQKLVTTSFYGERPVPTI